MSAKTWFSSRQHDWIELAATVLLSLATIVAAWSAYQSTRWNGEQTNSFSMAGARRIEAMQYHATYSTLVQIDVVSWLTYLEQVQAGNETGAAFIRDRLRDEFVPAFEAWLALAEGGEVPGGTPFELPQYQPESRQMAERLNAEANALTTVATEANQTGDNFVLVAVIMASVLFFAGVGTKVRGPRTRLVMLGLGAVLYVGGTAFMLALPQNVGI